MKKIGETKPLLNRNRKGSFGEVYYLSDCTAVKYIETKKDVKSSDIERELRIIEHLKTHPHDNIIKIHKYTTISLCAKFMQLIYCNPTLDYAYIHMKWIEKSLRDKMNDCNSRSITIDNMKHLATGISNGIKHLHNQSILHLDLKPDNIMVDTHNIPKIIDFGLSKFIENYDSRIKCGTPNYQLWYINHNLFCLNENPTLLDWVSFYLICLEMRGDYCRRVNNQNPRILELENVKINYNDPIATILIKQKDFDKDEVKLLSNKLSDIEIANFFQLRSTSPKSVMSFVNEHEETQFSEETQFPMEF